MQFTYSVFGIVFFYWNTKMLFIQEQNKLKYNVNHIKETIQVGSNLFIITFYFPVWSLIGSYILARGAKRPMGIYTQCCIIFNKCMSSIYKVKGIISNHPSRINIAGQMVDVYFLFILTWCRFNRRLFYKKSETSIVNLFQLLRSTAKLFFFNGKLNGLYFIRDWNITLF